MATRIGQPGAQTFSVGQDAWRALPQGEYIISVPFARSHAALLTPALSPPPYSPHTPLPTAYYRLLAASPGLVIPGYYLVTISLLSRHYRATISLLSRYYRAAWSGHPLADLGLGGSSSHYLLTHPTHPTPPAPARSAWFKN